LFSFVEDSTIVLDDLAFPALLLLLSSPTVCDLVWCLLLLLITDPRLGRDDDAEEKEELFFKTELLRCLGKLLGTRGSLSLSPAAPTESDDDDDEEEEEVVGSTLLALLAVWEPFSECLLWCDLPELELLLLLPLPLLLLSLSLNLLRWTPV
jgi:hypothetical protein